MGVDAIACTDACVKKQFQTLALKHHPDRGGDAQSFDELRQAYAEIATEERRSVYVAWTQQCRRPRTTLACLESNELVRVGVAVLILGIWGCLWGCSILFATCGILGFLLLLAAPVVRTMQLVPYWILPASGRPRMNTYAALATWRNRQPQWSHVELETSPNILLSAAAWMNPSLQSISQEEQRWLVYCGGSTSSWETTYEYVACIAHAAGVNALVFNYRGVGGSGGFARTAADLVEDGRAAVRWVQRRGVLPELILVVGRGLGGAVAAHVAEAERCGGLLCSHTFTSLAAQAASYLEVLAASDSKRGTVTPNRSSVTVRWAAPLVWLAMGLMGWRLDVLGPLRRFKGRIWVIYHPKDGVVCARGVYKGLPGRGVQLREALGQHRNPNLKVLRMASNWDGRQAHNYPNADSSDFNSIIARIKYFSRSA